MNKERTARIAPRRAGPSRIERLLLVATPAAAMLAVALGLRLGASSTFQAAVVYAAPQADAKTGLAWQLLTFREGHGGREAVSIPNLRLVARAAALEVHWQGATNEDGVAEVLLPLPSEDGVHLEVTSGATLLAAGDARSAPPLERSPTASTWARFARREGRIALDVAVSGQRVASGFPASIWVRASDSASSVPLGGIAIEPEDDTSFRPALLSARTDARGWAEIIGTPVGHVVSMTLHARAVDGRQGLWIGGLFVSPGAAHLHVRQRFAPDEEPIVEVVAPSERTTAAYLEIDDRRGRAWATEIKLSAEGGGLPRGSARVPRLAPGLYWAVYSSDPEGAAHLGPGTLARPFAVAPTDTSALAFGSDPSECAPPLDGREAPRVLSVCLALATATPVPRWMALEGLSMQQAADERRRIGGMWLALAAIAVAMALETLLLLRAAAATRAHLRAAAEEGGSAIASAGLPWRVGVSLLVAVLGFVLLAAFVARVG